MKLTGGLSTTGSAAAAATVIVGLNGALQKRFILPPGVALVPGDVHRASRVQVGLGGKGQDVAITLSCLQYSNVKLVQFVGSGAEGEQVYRLLRDEFGEDALGLTVRSTSGMRTCTSIVSDTSTTELVEPSGTIDGSEVDELLDRLDGTSADALCIMGSMPPGCDDDTYANIYKRVAGRNTLTVIDTVVGLGPLLKEIAEQRLQQNEATGGAAVGGSGAGGAGPTILKCNASELCRLAGVQKSRSEAHGVHQDEIVQALVSFLKKYSDARVALTAIAVTDGSHPSYLATMPISSETEFRLFQLPVAKLREASTPSAENTATPSWGHWTGSQSSISEPSQAIYPIGAGDAVAAGTLAAWKALTDKPGGPSRVHDDIRTALAGNETPATRAMLTAFSFGLACGTASCLNQENSLVTIHDVLEIFKREERPHFLSCHSIL